MSPLPLPLILFSYIGVFVFLQGIDAEGVKRFTDFPLSSRTLAGLRTASYVTPTKIQTDALARALEVCIGLGAGSGAERTRKQKESQPLKETAGS